MASLKTGHFWGTFDICIRIRIRILSRIRRHLTERDGMARSAAHGISKHKTKGYRLCLGKKPGGGYRTFWLGHHRALAEYAAYMFRERYGFMRDRGRQTWTKQDEDAVWEWVSNMISGGVGYRGMFLSRSDILGAAFSWGEPTKQGLRSQYATEIFYRLQVSPDNQFTIGYQWIIDPSNDPTEGTVGVFELRWRLSL
jgi:hypothetical protein